MFKPLKRSQGFRRCKLRSTRTSIRKKKLSITKFSLWGQHFLVSNKRSKVIKRVRMHLTYLTASSTVMTIIFKRIGSLTVLLWRAASRRASLTCLPTTHLETAALRGTIRMKLTISNSWSARRRETAEAQTLSTTPLELSSLEATRCRVNPRTTRNFRRGKLWRVSKRKQAKRVMTGWSSITSLIQI